MPWRTQHTMEQDLKTKGCLGFIVLIRLVFFLKKIRARLTQFMYVCETSFRYESVEKNGDQNGLRKLPNGVNEVLVFWHLTDFVRTPVKRNSNVLLLPGTFERPEERNANVFSPDLGINMCFKLFINMSYSLGCLLLHFHMP